MRADVMPPRTFKFEPELPPEPESEAPEPKRAGGWRGWAQPAEWGQPPGRWFVICTGATEAACSRKLWQLRPEGRHNLICLPDTVHPAHRGDRVFSEKPWSS